MLIKITSLWCKIRNYVSSSWYEFFLPTTMFLLTERLMFFANKPKIYITTMSRFSRIRMEFRLIGPSRLKLLKTVTPDFIPPNVWPPNNPDLNIVDYKIWGTLQVQVYKTKIKDVHEHCGGMGSVLHRQSHWRMESDEILSLCGCRRRTIWTKHMNSSHCWSFVAIVF